MIRPGLALALGECEPPRPAPDDPYEAGDGFDVDCWRCCDRGFACGVHAWLADLVDDYSP